MAIYNGKIGYIDFEGHMRTVQYRVDEVLKKWVHEFADILGAQNFKIDMKWERDPSIMGHRLRVYVNNWVTQYIVDDRMFDHVQKDVEYIRYIGEQVVRCSQSGIIMGWLEQLYRDTDDQYDLAKMWSQDLSKGVKEAYFQRTPSLGARADHHDLIHLILHDYPVPITSTIKEVMDEPKLLLARLTMMKR